MKSKAALLSLVSLLFSFASIAQEIENDDMYFNSKDRAKLNEARAKQATYTASIKKTKKEVVAEEEVSNPTDSYSARNVNPEYEARSNSESAQADNADYFVNNYQYNNAAKYNNWNDNFNRWYSSPWYGANYYDPFISSWNTPYYGSYYDAWGNPWRNPYFRSGWSSSFSFHWGNSWNYGWGTDFGYGNYYNPYNSWAWSPYYGYSSWGPSYYGGWGYPNVIIVESGNKYGPAYGKRGSRSSELSRDYVNRSGRSSSRDVVNPDNSSRPITGGRVGTTTSRQPEYYNRSWRSQSQNSSSYDNSSRDNSNSNPSRSSWENNSRNSWRDSNSGGSSSRSYDAGRSSTGGGGSSGGSGGGSSSSGSRSSGRGH